MDRLLYLHIETYLTDVLSCMEQVINGQHRLTISEPTLRMSPHRTPSEYMLPQHPRDRARLEHS